MLIVLKIPESAILEVILLAATKFFRMFVALPMLVLVFTAQPRALVRAKAKLSEA